MSSTPEEHVDDRVDDDDLEVADEEVDAVRGGSVSSPLREGGPGGH